MHSLMVYTASFISSGSLVKVEWCLRQIRTDRVVSIYPAQRNHKKLGLQGV